MAPACVSMMNSGYSKIKEIYRGRRRTVYRGLYDEDNKPVIIKTERDDCASAYALDLLKHEFDILKTLNDDCIVRKRLKNRRVAQQTVI